MITRFQIENFKRLGCADLELGSNVVLIGPNNSGKTTALQALTLWDAGWRRWAEKRDGSGASVRSGVTLNRRDLYSLPIPSARLLWKNLHTQDTKTIDGKQKTEKSYITLAAEGIHNDGPWRCALEFYYANEESFYCRLKEPDHNRVPDGVRAHRVVYLPPMSGLSDREYRKEPGEINVLIGEGQTAQVLRNLCWQLYSGSDRAAWSKLVDQIEETFHISLNEPEYIKERSELVLKYREQSSGVELDISSVGRGCQQVLLLLSYMLANPGAVLLVDEPDAHLEILRQRDVYNMLTRIASESGSQVIAASHSEVVLQEAAERDVVVAFVGTPHRIDTRSGQKTQVRKALASIRMADYYVAEQKGWMLYLEGSTDLSILASLAERLNHPAKDILSAGPPVYYVGSNDPQRARTHFQGLREAKKDLIGFALFDRLDRELHTGSRLTECALKQREIENYLVTPESLRTFVVKDLRDDDLIERSQKEKRLTVLDEVVRELEGALRLTSAPDPWGPDIKVTDQFLDPLFKNFFERLGTPQRIYKRDYHGLADCIPLEQLDPEVVYVLDALWEVAQRAAVPL